MHAIVNGSPSARYHAPAGGQCRRRDVSGAHVQGPNHREGVGAGRRVRHTVMTMRAKKKEIANEDAVKRAEGIIGA